MTIDAILFDLDGTLVDTEPVAARAVRAWFDGRGIAVDPGDAQYVTGRKWEAAFDLLFGRYQVPIPRVEAEREIIALYKRELARELPVVPGGADAVRALAPHYPLAVVSGSHRAEILWALDRLAIRSEFRFVLGAEDYARSKPAPDGFAKAMEMLKAMPARTLVFEDSAAGILAARAAGAWVAAVTSTNHFGQDHSRAHARIHDLTGVTPEWVRGLALA